MRNLTKVLLTMTVALMTYGFSQGQYLRPKNPKVGPLKKTVETGLTKIPTEKELTTMVLKVLKADEHKEFMQKIQDNQPSRPKGKTFEQAFRWDLVRTRGWTTNEPYIRAYCMLGNIMSATIALPVKVVNKKLVVDKDRQMHGCIPIECPVCILQFNTDSLLLGCSTYGVDEAYYKAHPEATCYHYLRKPYGEYLTKELDPALLNPKAYKKATPANNKKQIRKKRD